MEYFSTSLMLGCHKQAISNIIFTKEKHFGHILLKSNKSRFLINYFNGGNTHKTNPKFLASKRFPQFLHPITALLSMRLSHQSMENNKVNPYRLSLDKTIYSDLWERHSSYDQLPVLFLCVYYSQQWAKLKEIGVPCWTCLDSSLICEVEGCLNQESYLLCTRVFFFSLLYFFSFFWGTV